MKKIAALVLSILLALGLLAACSSQPDVSGTSEASQEQESVKATEEATTTEEATVSEEAEMSGELKPFKLGWIGAGSPEMMVGFTTPAKWACDAAGGEMVIDTSATDAASQISVVENLISAGCNLIAITNFFGDAPMPKISKICNENEVYWVLWDATIADPAILETLENDPYFVGFTQQDQTKIATEGANALIDAGCKNIIAYKYAVGVYTADKRIEVLQKICEENGVNIVRVIEAPQDAKKAMADALIANPEADGFYAVGGLAIQMISAIEDANRDMKIVCGNIEGIDKYFDDGSVIAVHGGLTSSNFVAIMMLINAYNGTPLTTGADTVDIPVIPFTSSKERQDFKMYTEGDDAVAVYGKEDLDMFLKVLNPSLTLEDLQQNLNDTWNMDYIAEKSSK